MITFANRINEAAISNLYLGGVVGLAALGILEWPVAAVAGVGLAIANGRRRARA